LAELGDAALAAYPQTKTALTYQKDVAAAEPVVAATLGAHSTVK
jgi:hypothetical protein